MHATRDCRPARRGPMPYCPLHIVTPPPLLLRSAPCTCTTRSCPCEQAAASSPCSRQVHQRAHVLHQPPALPAAVRGRGAPVQALDGRRGPWEGAGRGADGRAVRALVAVQEARMRQRRPCAHAPALAPRRSHWRGAPQRAALKSAPTPRYARDITAACTRRLRRAAPGAHRSAPPRRGGGCPGSRAPASATAPPRAPPARRAHGTSPPPSLISTTSPMRPRAAARCKHAARAARARTVRRTRQGSCMPAPPLASAGGAGGGCVITRALCGAARRTRALQHTVQARCSQPSMVRISTLTLTLS